MQLNSHRTLTPGLATMPDDLARQNSPHTGIDRAPYVQYSLHVVTLYGTRRATRFMPRFTPGELHVMRLLWQHGELKPGEIARHYPEPIKDPALRSYLSILVEKGHISRRKAGKAYLYKAVTRQVSAFRAMLRELIDAYCEGSAQALVLNLIRSERLSDEELAELRRMIDASKAAQTAPQKTPA